MLDLEAIEERGVASLTDVHDLVCEVRALRADVLAKDQILNHPCRNCGEEL